MKDNSQKLFIFITAIFMTLFMLPTMVLAEEKCNDVESNSELTTALSGSCSTISLQKDANITGTDSYTITKDIAIVGNGATIKGTINITGGTNINISDLTMTDGTTNNQAKPEYISVQSSNVKLNVSKVKIYYGNMNNSSEFIKYGTGIVVYNSSGDGSTVEVTDSIIHTKYAIWIEGSNSNLNVKNSELSGYAALDLTSSGGKTSNNNITIDNSKLTGYALGKAAQNNNYGTIVIGNKDQVNINIINNSVITNNLDNNGDARSDLILISNANALPKNVKVNVSNSTLKNTNNTYGAVYNANETNDNSFKTKNTTIIGKLIEGEKEQFYVDFIVDGKNNVVLVNENGTVSSSDIPKPIKSGYTFVGWYTEQTYQNVFDTTAEVKNNTTVYAKFIRNATSSTTPGNQEENPSDTTPVVPEAQAPDTTDAKNPNTADNFYSLISMLIASTAGLFIVFKKNILN